MKEKVRQVRELNEMKQKVMPQSFLGSLGGALFSNFKKIIKNDYFKDIWYIRPLPYD